MSNVTASTTARDLATVRTYCTRSAAQTARLADALVRLSDAKMSVRDIAAAITDTDAPLGRNRLALIIRTRRENVTADPDTFRALLAEATAANTGTRKAPAVSPEGTDGEPVTADTAAAAVTAAVTDVTPVTVDALTDALASLFEQARLLDTSDRIRFLAAVDAEVAYSTPVTIAVPVAA